jgi:alpha-ketoglutaric semialdehyde dehydrogenase
VEAAPALAYGNAVLLKPASEATAVGVRTAELMAPALPDGLLQVLPGGRHVAQAAIRHADVVSFTDSVEAGRSVRDAATALGVPVQCEMGGQNASIVLADADPEAAAAQIAGVAMAYVGQKCTATSRVIVVGGRAEVTEALVAAVRGLGVGDPAQAGVLVGPVIDRGSRDAVVDAAEGARRGGGRVLTGGERGGGDGWMVLPTLIDSLPAEAPLAQHEVFGPIATIHPARDVEEAIRLANGVEYGLVTSVYTSDVSRVLWAVERVDTGLVKVNSPTTGVDFYAPFGGEKASSHGPREQGKAARELYTTTQTITISPL